MHRRRNSLRHLRWTTCLLVGLAGLGLWPAREACAGLTSVERQQRSQDVQRMSAIERARLQRNWETFQKLSAEDQQRYRTLHQELQQDHGQLKQLVTTYTQWLQMLNPGQRQDLQEAKDPAHKLALVRKFKEEQDQQQEGHSLNEEMFASGRDRRLRWTLRRVLPRRPPLSSSDLAGVMETLSQDLSADEQTRIKSLEKWARYRQVLEGSAREAGGPQNWPTREQQDAIRNPQKESGPTRNKEPDPGRNSEKFDEFRRGVAGRLIVGSLIAEMLQDSQAYHPKDEELQKILQELDNDEKDKLIRSSELQDELLKRYYRQRTDEAFQDFMKTKHDFLDFLFRFMKDAHLGGGFGGRGGPPGAGQFREFDRNRDGGAGFPPPDGRGRRGPPPDERRNPPSDGQ